MLKKIKEVVKTYFFEKLKILKETNFFLLLFKISLVYLSLYYMLLSLNLNFFISLLIVYVSHKLIWNVFLNWYILDLINGLIIFFFKKKKIKLNRYFNYYKKIYHKTNNYFNVNKIIHVIINIYKYINIYIYVIIFIYIITYIYNIYNNIYNMYILYILFILYITTLIYNYNYYNTINTYYLIILINLNKLTHKLSLKLYIHYNTYNSYIRLLNKTKLVLFNNQYNNIIISKAIKNYIYNLTIYLCDPLEYKIRYFKKFFKNKNIEKVHRKAKPNPNKLVLKKIISERNKLIKLNLLNLWNKLIKYSESNLSIKNNLFNFFKVNNRTNLNYLKSCKSFKISKYNFSYLNEPLMYIYMFIYYVTCLLTEIPLTITYNLVKTNKKYLISYIVKKQINMYTAFKKINYKYKLHTLYKNLNYMIYTFFSKTIYITLILTFFFNKDLSNIFIHNLYNNYLYDIALKVKYFLIINIISSYNLISLFILFSGLFSILYWSKTNHKFFGKYLWIMIVLPVFIQINYILYTKTAFTNVYSFINLEYVLIIKYNLIELYNYNIFKLYTIFKISILIIIFIYFINIGVFRSIYLKIGFKRVKYIVYPATIILLEYYRFFFIKYVSLMYLSIFNYFNLGAKIPLAILTITNNDLTLLMIDFISRFIYEINYFNYTIISFYLIPNCYLLNLIIDTIIFITALTWLKKYSNKLKNVDLKFVAFPVMCFEKALKYLFIYYSLIYFFKLCYTLLIQHTILLYSFQLLVITYLYLELRVHKFPRKTMPWYFRQIVETWPSTIATQWYTSRYLYLDQQRYIVMRFRLKTFKIYYKSNYKELEIWNKIIVLNYQKEKTNVLSQLSSFCRLMSRKENMLKELTSFEYQGWYEDWQFNYPQINIYKWKLDLWDKPYIYQFNKTSLFTNVRIYYFNYIPIVEKFCFKYTWLTYMFFLLNILDSYYTNKYLYIFEDEDEIPSLSKKEWKSFFFNNFDKLEELTHLKNLKIVLMSFSSGENIKTPDWIFPPIYEKEYKKKGWEMFENPEIDSIELDWRPLIRDLN